MTDATAPTPAPLAPPSLYRHYVVGGLFVIYTFNFIDRQIVAVMQEPIKAAFGLADWQLGLLTGPAFAVLYAILGLPLAWLADRSNRVTIISISLAVWSGFTALFGLVNSYMMLFLMRVGVGIGEAGCSPPSHSLISDYVPPRQRAGALSIYSLGIPVGSVLGIPGIVLAVIVKLTIKEPPRGRFDAAAKKAMPSIWAVLSTLRGKPTFWLLAFGAAIASLVGYGLFPWILSYFIRLYAGEMPLQDAVAAAAIPYSFVIGGGGFIGTLAGGWLTDKFSGNRLSAYLVIPGVALLVSLPIYFVALGIPPGAMAFVLLGIASALGAMWYGRSGR